MSSGRKTCSALLSGCFFVVREESGAPRETLILPGSTPGKATSTITALSVSITSTGGSQVGTREAARTGRNISRCKRSARSSISIASDHIQWRGKFNPIIFPAARMSNSDLLKRDADWRRMAPATRYRGCGSSPSTTCKSVRQTPHATTLTRICPGPGCLSGRSVHSRGVLGLYSTIACTAFSFASSVRLPSAR